MLRGIHLLAAFGNRMLDWIDPKSMKLDFHETGWLQTNFNGSAQHHNNGSQISENREEEED